MPRSNSIAERLVASATRMARTSAMILIALAITGCATHPARETAEATRVHCTAGPLPASFGALPWLLYACDDGRSVALVSAPGNPAAPFTFVVRPSDHGVRVQGDGAGDRGATAPAFAELMALDADALLRLYARALLEAEPDGG